MVGNTMKLILVLFVGFAAANDVDLWKQFKLDHGKTYKSLREENLRFSIFQSTLRHIEEHNQKYNNGEVTYYLKVNQFADLTDKEFKEMYLTFKPSEIKTGDIYEPKDINEPDSIDWRMKGVVTEVKDQGNCGSCWAFSVVGAVESQAAIVSNKHVTLSEQQFIDCDTFNLGCSGGDIIVSLIDMTNTTLFTGKSYPYIADQGECKKDGVDAGVKIWGSLTIFPLEETLKEAVGTRGPVSVAIHGDDLKHYGSGIYNNPNCSHALDHAVLVVGYGVEDGLDYWIIKNSWGKSWGERGYFKLARNKNRQCGIGSLSAIPIMEV